MPRLLLLQNAEFMDYRYATGFEALLGYLFLNNDIERLMYIFEKLLR